MFNVYHMEEKINKTFRFPKSLLEKMSVIAQNGNVSLNSFVVQCCEYAIDNLKDSSDETDTIP